MELIVILFFAFYYILNCAVTEASGNVGREIGYSL